MVLLRNFAFLASICGNNYIKIINFKDYVVFKDIFLVNRLL